MKLGPVILGTVYGTFHSVRLVWGHSVHFAKFSDVKTDFQKSTAPPVFIQFHPNLIKSNHGRILDVTFFGDLPNVRIRTLLKFC